MVVVLVGHMVASVDVGALGREINHKGGRMVVLLIDRGGRPRRQVLLIDGDVSAQLFAADHHRVCACRWPSK